MWIINITIEVFMLTKKKVKSYLGVNFKWWQWIFYIIGWLAGATNVLFWIVMYVIYSSKEDEVKFFNPNFHRRVSNWGIFVTIVMGLMSLLTAFSTV